MYFFPSTFQLNVAENTVSIFLFCHYAGGTEKNYTMYDWWLIDIFPDLKSNNKVLLLSIRFMIEKIPIKKLSKYCQKQYILYKKKILTAQR